MTDWIVDLVVTGNITAILIIVVLLLLTGGVGSAIVTGITASRRGVKGDAIAKEQNGISGLGKLTEAQDDFITQLRHEFSEYKIETQTRFREIEERFNAEVAHSNRLTSQLINAGIIPEPRTS